MGAGYKAIGMALAGIISYEAVKRSKVCPKLKKMIKDLNKDFKVKGGKLR